MSVLETLRRARELVAGGWNEPMCRDAFGCWCTPNDECLVDFSVDGAVCAAATEAGDISGALAALRAVALPASSAFEQVAERFLDSGTEEDALVVVQVAGVAGSDGDLQGWLEAPGRKLEHVLAVFDKAVLRAKREGRAA